jgi:NAD-dependent SIR2 family protein deacetylase
MTAIRNIVILTGAGISAESGIDTFRGAGGLWENHRVEDVATPEAFARDPNLVLRFYDMRRAAIQEKLPNAAHFALAELDAKWPGKVLIVTQNVDDLHTRAGARRVLHMHGEHLKAWCTSCDVRSHWRGPLIDRPPCPVCQARSLRPDVVWFGEMPYRMARSTPRCARRTCSFPSALQARSIPPPDWSRTPANLARRHWNSISRPARARTGSTNRGLARRARWSRPGWRSF